MFITKQNIYIINENNGVKLPLWNCSHTIVVNHEADNVYWNTVIVCVQKEQETGRF